MTPYETFDASGVSTTYEQLDAVYRKSLLIR
jgi:hypothetical protein